MKLNTDETKYINETWHPCLYVSHSRLSHLDACLTVTPAFVFPRRRTSKQKNVPLKLLKHAAHTMWASIVTQTNKTPSGTNTRNLFLIGFQGFFSVSR